MAGIVTFEEVVVGLLDYTDKFVDSDANSTVEERLNVVVPADQILYVDRLIIRSTSAAFTEFFLYEDDSDNVHIREWTDVGPTNVADEASPIRFKAGSRLIARWTGLTAGATVTIHLEGRFVKQVVRLVPEVAEVAVQSRPAVSSDDMRGFLAELLERDELSEV